MPRALGSDQDADCTSFYMTPTQLRRLVALAFDAGGFDNSISNTQQASSPVERYQNELNRMGGTGGIASALNVSIHDGLSTSVGNEKSNRNIEYRRKVFGANYIAPPPPISLLRLVLQAAVFDVTNAILLAVGIISIALGMAVGGNPTVDSMEGTCVVVAVGVIAFVSAFTEYQKDKQFRALNAVNDNEDVSVYRQGRRCYIKKWDLVVGELVPLAVGDIVPGDGIILHATQFQVDESTLTGESALVDKHVEQVAFAGTQVMQGVGSILVLAVGANTQYGQILTLVHGDTSPVEKLSPNQEEMIDQEYVEIRTPRTSTTKEPVVKSSRHTRKTPFAEKLERLNLRLGQAGVVIALLVFSVMSIRFSIDAFVYNDRTWEASLLRPYLSYFLLAVTVLVVAIPEGLPLAVAIALSHSVRQMLREQNLVRHMHACETAGNATTICSDKTGTLTTNVMTVVNVWFDPNASYRAHRPVDTVDQMTFPVRTLFYESLALNSTVDEVSRDSIDHDKEVQFSGSPTEAALLRLLCKCRVNFHQVRQDATVVRMLPFSSDRKRMSVVIQKESSLRMYTKGASETLVELCTSRQRPDGSVLPLDGTAKTEILQTISQYATQGHRTLCLAYRDMSYNSLEWVETIDESELETQLTFLCIVAIADPVRPDVPTAIEQCKRAGIVVRMVTGDNILTARAIASECGILTDDMSCTDGPVVLEGPEFRRQVTDTNGGLVQTSFDAIWPSLRVLARSSPQDKYLLVKGLMATRGDAENTEQLVAVTGDGTNDAPALQEAHVGFAMGRGGTAVAKQAADIVVLNDDFSSLVNAIKWGRNVHDAISKFLQFQLTVIATAVLIAAIGAVSMQQSPITAVQILWVNLFMDSFASLGLATTPPTSSLLDRKPYLKSRSVLSSTMLKHIIGQTTYQLTILLLLTFLGDNWLAIPSGRPSVELRDAEMMQTEEATQHLTIVFNAFFWLQLFNEINCRKLHDETHAIDRGLCHDATFIIGWGLQVALQVVIVQFGGALFHCAPLSAVQWLICIGIGALALPIRYVLCCLPFASPVAS